MTPFAQEGDIDEDAYRDLFKVGSGYIAIKESMNMLGRPGGYSRPPMQPFTEEQRSQLRKIYEDVGLLIPSGAY